MHLEVMRVDLPRQPIKKATPLPRPTPTNQHEAQSSTPVSSVPTSFMNASMRNIIQEELGIFERSLIKKVVEAIEAKVNLMLPVMERHNMIVKTNLEALVQRVSNLEEAVNKLKSSPHVPSASSPEPTSSSHVDATEAQMDPVMAVIAAIEGEEAQNDPLPPSTEPKIHPLSFDPSNPLPISHPQAPTINSNPSSESSSHQPSPDLSSPHLYLSLYLSFFLLEILLILHLYQTFLPFPIPLTLSQTTSSDSTASLFDYAKGGETSDT